MSKLKDTLRKAVGNGSPVAGLTKISIDDIIEQYEGIVTLNGVSYAEYNGDRYPVFTFLEDERRYFSGGKALRDMADILVESYDGDISAVNKALKAEPTRILLNKIRTKNNRPFTTVAILDDVPDSNPSHDPPINLETGEILDK